MLKLTILHKVAIYMQVCSYTHSYMCIYIYKYILYSRKVCHLILKRFGERKFDESWVLNSKHSVYALPCNLSMHMVAKPSPVCLVIDYHVTGDSGKSSIWYWSFKFCYRLRNTWLSYIYKIFGRIQLEIV